MNGEKDVKASGARTPENKRYLVDGTRGLGRFGSESEDFGDEQDSIGYEGCQGRNSPREDFHQLNPEGNFGKILSQLREISESHLAYVRAHKQRLAAKLNDAEEHERKFMNQVESVEMQIRSLVESLNN